MSRHIDRRAVLAGVIPAGVAAGSVAVAPSAMALPSIRMDRVVVQAQVEPWTNRNSRIAGDYAVKEVQRALRAKIGGVVVDGHYGDQTRDAYATWQRRLGYSGLGANGIPGPTSLTRLGNNRFDVTHKIKVGSRTTYSGVSVNQRTRNMLVRARGKIGWSWDVTQGGYNGCSSYSACTHAGGGAVDVILDWGNARGWKTVRALRAVGFAAWLRTPDQGDWVKHIHAIAIGDTDTHRQAADQVGDYYIGRNGLASHAADNQPDGYDPGFTWWEKVR